MAAIASLQTFYEHNKAKLLPYLPCAHIICMTFEYDPQKVRINRQKHGISFAEAELVFAELVFFDPLAIHDVDPEAKGKERLIAVEMANSGQLLVVVYTMRGDSIRLISA